jgi:two-component system response regulator RegX3
MTTILVVEDEVSLREPLVFLLQKEGFKTIEAKDGEEAIVLFRSANPDIVLLDLMLPGKSGIEVCREIREHSNVPIIMVTAKDSEVDRVVGLEIGADDYIVKPYSTRELVARVRAVLRRGTEQKPSSTGMVISGGSVTLDPERHRVTVSGESISMPLKEFELLEYLMENQGRVLTRGQIIDRIWGADYFGDTKTLDVHIKRLRTKIEPDSAEPKHIITIRGLGYKFEV